MKKLIALLLALVMVIAMVACGNANTPAETEAPKADAPAETEAPKADAPAETEAPAADEEPTVITIGVGKRDTVEDYDTNAMTLMYEEALNIDIQWVFFSSDAGEYATQFGLMTTNEETLPDIVMGMKDIALYNEYGEMGYFIDLKPYMTDPEKTPMFHSQMEVCGEDEKNFVMGQITVPGSGAIYNWPSFSITYLNRTQHHQYLNKAWLDELGMDVPRTTDEMYEFLKAAKEAHPEGVGVIGGVGYRSNSLEWLLNAFIYNYDDYFWNVENGQLYAPYTTDEYRQGLIWCRKLADEGLIDPITYTGANGDIIPYSTPAGSERGGAACIAGNLSLSTENGHPGVLDYTPAVVLDAGTGKGGYQGWLTNTIEVGLGITADCQNVDKCIELMDLMCSPEMTITSQVGIRGIHWDWVDPDEGAISSAGTPATYYRIDGQDIWQSQNNYIWNFTPSGIFNAKAVDRWVDDGSLDSQKIKIMADLYRSDMSMPVPDEVCRTLIYTAEEQEVVSEVKNILRDYVRSQTALFVSGELDPSNDAHWQTFCDELVAQGMNEWQVVAQAAYTRMNG